MRLIDADKLKAHYAWWGEENENKRLFDSVVDAQPTVDAVEIVRCKDCKYWEDGNIYLPEGGCSRFYERTTMDDGCSFGKRRDGE